MAFEAEAGKAERPCLLLLQKESDDKAASASSTEVIVSSSDDDGVEVQHLREDARNSASSAGTRRVFRLTFRGRTVFEHTSSSSSSSTILSSTTASCQGERPPHNPVVPNWVTALASRCQEELAGDAAVELVPRFLMTKKVTKTDLDGDENRLLIPAGFVKANVIPLLSDNEKKAASLDGYPKKRKRETPLTSEEEELELQLRVPSKRPRKTMEKGRQHGGLQVTAWTMSRWFFDSLSLTCWDQNNATVLKGGHLKYLYDRSFLSEGDHVELWGFRDVRRQLHLALHKSASSSPRSHAVHAMIN